MDSPEVAIEIKTRAKAAYDATDVIWPESDSWSTHTRDFIRTVLGKNIPVPKRLVLNAGCGGNDYGILRFSDCVNLDISSQQCSQSNWPLVGDVEALPFPDECFDLIICVGAVINYCEPYNAIPELIRVLKKDAILYLDFETTTTAETLFSPHWGKRVSVIERPFADRMDKTYLFSLYHIKSIVKSSNCDMQATWRYHTATAIWRRIFPLSRLPQPILAIDKYVSVVPGLNMLASNIIFSCRKNR